MSIKPVDFQVMLPRTMEAAKVSNDMTQRHITAQQQQVSATLHKAEDSLKQVYSRMEAQDVRIAEKQKENRQKDGKKKKDGSHSGESGNNGNSSLNNDIKTSTIDIKV